MPRDRASVTNGPPVNHSRRSWSNNGVHYTLETTSFSSPNISFGMVGGTTRSPFQGMFTSGQSNSRTESNSGLLGTAFNLLGDVLAAQQQVTSQSNARRGARHHSVDDSARPRGERSNQPRSFVNKFAERLANTYQRPRTKPRSRDHSPAGTRPSRASQGHGSRSFRTEERQPAGANSRNAYAEEFTDSEDDSYSSDSDLSDEDQAQSAFTATDASVIEALNNAAEHHRREARKCGERIQQISRQPTASSAVLQTQLNELKRHEQSYENALYNLKMAKEGTRGTASQRKGSSQNGNAQNRQRPTPREDEFFATSSPHDFAGFFQTRRQTHPIFADFDELGTFPSASFGAFHRSFTEFNTGSSPADDFFNFFTMPEPTFGGAQRQRGSFTANTGGRFRQPAGFTTFSAPPQSPPATLLKPEEAKLLFNTYNQRWNALSPTDPNIPYPARRLQAAALAARDSIWAPLVSSPIANWSDEAVMQANAQAFFLGVVGLSPEYTEAPGTGRIVMGYNKAKASPTQVQQLVDILKKEKARWHSDRLGRRNGGLSGPNEVLQANDKARAVFHAVCELVETAQQ